MFSNLTKFSFSCRCLDKSLKWWHTLNQEKKKFIHILTANTATKPALESCTRPFLIHCFLSEKDMPAHPLTFRSCTISHRCSQALQPHCRQGQTQGATSKYKHTSSSIMHSEQTVRHRAISLPAPAKQQLSCSSCSAPSAIRQTHPKVLALKPATVA